MVSLSNEKIKSLDKSGSMKYLETFPEDCKFAFELTLKNFKDKKMKKDFEKFVSFGMGGSGISCDILKFLLSDIDIHVYKNYDLPDFIDDEFFAIAISYSGNTEETINTLKEAKKRGIDYLSVFSGGELSEIKPEEGSFIARVPSNILPRLTLSHMFFSILGFFQSMEITDKENDVKETIQVLSELKEKLIFKNNDKNPAKEIAEGLKGRIPIIHSYSPYTAVSLRSKEAFNENSKNPAFNENIPNICHNSILGWQSKKLNKNLAFIVIRDEKIENDKMKIRMDATIETMKKTSARVIEIRPIGRSLLAKMFSLIYILDYVSFYLGFLNGVDPADTDAIEEFKKKLSPVKKDEHKAKEK